MKWIVLIAFAFAGTAFAQRPPAPERTTPAELERALYVYADRYTALIVAGTDAIQRQNPTPEQRRLAHLFGAQVERVYAASPREGKRAATWGDLGADGTWARAARGARALINPTSAKQEARCAASARYPDCA